MSDRCVGHCCRAFFLPYSPDEFRRAFASWWNGDGTYLDDRGELRGEINEIAILAPMVVFLGLFNGAPPGHRVLDAAHKPDDPPGHWYTCRNLDRTTGDCRIYENRPAMCRDYPYGRGCGYLDCAWNAARRERLALVERAQAEACIDLGGEA